MLSAPPETANAQRSEPGAACPVAAAKAFLKRTRSIARQNLSSSESAGAAKTAPLAGGAATDIAGRFWKLFAQLFESDASVLLLVDPRQG